MRYFFETKLRKAGEKEEAPEEALEIRVMTEEELCRQETPEPLRAALLRSIKQLRYCKAETFGDCVMGTVSVPNRDHPMDERTGFAYYLTRKSCLLADREGCLFPLMDRLEETEHEGHTGMGFFFSGLLNEIVRDDVIWLQKKEEKLMEAEDELVKGRGVPSRFPERIQSWRRELMILHAYYEQLADMGEDLRENTEGVFSLQERAAFERFSAKADRLHDHVEMLREYSAQIREMYQSKLDLEQNRIMSMLTVVTTIFLPLSILVGWYGMNFANMPELQWKYGYLGVILLSAVMVLGEVLYFKKKKMLK